MLQQTHLAGTAAQDWTAAAEDHSDQGRQRMKVDGNQVQEAQSNNEALGG